MLICEPGEDDKSLVCEAVEDAEGGSEESIILEAEKDLDSSLSPVVGSKVKTKGHGKPPIRYSKFGG